jgi:antitoxin component YwqK of YwqJK toxin-antitoxin module
MKKVVVVFMLLSISYFKAQVNTLESSLVLQNGLYYQNNAPYTGYALSYYPQEQIKSICEIKEGQKTGRFTSYYYDNSFNKINFKDTSKINQYTLKKSVLKEQINQLIKDTVDSYGKMTSYLKDEIGGEKKLLKIQEKSAEGDLKGKKLEEFNTYNNYVNKHNSAIQLLKEQQLASQKNEEKLSSELSKKEFFGVSKEQYQQKNGVKDGSFISHFENGKTSSEGIYKEGKYNDLWTFYHENGNIKGKGIFQMGDGSDLGNTGLPRNGRDGQWLLYHENGKISQDCGYFDGKRKGAFKSYFSNGKLEEESNISNEKYDGKYTSWFENGNLKKEGFFNNGKSFGLFKYYFETGVLSSEENWKDTLRDGIYKSYYENGKLKQDGIYKEGKVNGVFKWYHDNGKLKQEGTFINGKSSGLFKNYYPTGVLSSEVNWKDTLRDGIYKSYYENGKLKQDGIYKEGKVNGVFKWYHDNGKLKQEGTFINGKSSGLFKNYYPTGVLSSEENWKDTLRDGLCKYYHENGKIKSEKTFKNDVLNGSYKTFYDNGKIDEQFIMKNGKEHGEAKRYFESGVLKASWTLDTLSKQESNLFGEAKLFNESGTLIAHEYFNLDGTSINKMTNYNQSISSHENNNTKTGNLNATYKCKWCKKNINGIYDGFDVDGKEPNDMILNYHKSLYDSFYGNAESRETMKSIGNILGEKTPTSYAEYLIRNYEFCTPKCANEHKRSKN